MGNLRKGMFIGEYQHVLDPKHRLAVPSKFRGELGSRVVVTRGLDRCLFLYPMKVWEGIAEKLSSFPLGDPEARSFVRLLLAGAVEGDIDSQGRILLPEYLRKYASLEREVTVAGVFNRLEIWNAKRWQEYREKAEGDTDAVAEKLSQLGLY